MTEVAGLVLGIVALWKTCVDAFEVVDSSRNHGMEYELLRVKLEVERIRLHSWGNAIGLGEDDDNTFSDPRLKRRELADTVVQVLGCIHQLFENSNNLQNKYGLRPWAVNTQDMLSSPQGQPILGAVFKKAYEALRKNARERQTTTRMSRKTMWAIRDKQKFHTLIVEIKGFNDNLESLFVGSRARITEVIREDVESSASMEELHLLQEATAEEHNDISDCASARLEALGAASTMRSELLTVQENPLEQDANWQNDEAELDRDDGQTARAAESEMTELEKRVAAVELYCDKKHEGALTLAVLGPYDYSSKVTSHCYWGDKSESPWWAEQDKGFLKSIHASFDLYKKKRFRPKRNATKDEDLYDDAEENSVLFDVESYPEYENVIPGTVTVEGFGIEAWNLEDSRHPREQTILINASDHESLTSKKLLRRLFELQNRAEKLGWDPQRDYYDLREFTGNMGHHWVDPSYERREMTHLSDLYSLLNRTDIFANFLTTSSIGMEWHNSKKAGGGLWNLLWQIILAKELIRRFEHSRQDGWTSGFTPRVLASMIVADRWLNHVDIILTDPTMQISGIKPPETAELKAKAENFKKDGNEALSRKDYTKAIELYTEAMKIDLGSAVYRNNRSAACYALGRYEDALEDAYVATRLNPKYAKAWSRYGQAAAKLGLGKRAIDAYELAIKAAGRDVTEAMKRGLADAKEKDAADIKAINDEADAKKRDILRKQYAEQDFDTLLKSVEIHSRIHEQQVEGLLLFAEKIKWPWINEVRDYCEEAYSSLRGGETLPVHLYDWLFGMTLPGQWLSCTIMAALVLGTSSISNADDVVGQMDYDSGLVISKRSYWRVRTVLGRVLGCAPGVISLCGWVGPCPPVEFIPPLPHNAPSFVRLRARQVSLVQHKTFQNNGHVYIGGSGDVHPEVRICPDEEVESWMSDIQDANNWVVPEPPVKQVSTCELKAIQLKKDLSAKAKDDDHPAIYRAQVVFKMDDSDSLITYKLFTNPVFVSIPPCYGGTNGAHEVHLRELPRYDEKIQMS
ncbi:TPR domain containing protein [Paraphaeosphaeria sporulosa]